MHVHHLTSHVLIYKYRSLSIQQEEPSAAREFTSVYKKKEKMCGTTEQGHAIRHSSSPPQNVSPDARNNGASRNLSSDAVVNLDQYVCVYICVFFYS